MRLSDGGLWLDVLHCDLLEAQAGIGRDLVDLAITSAPYKEKDGYTRELMLALGRLAAHTLRPGGRLFFNFGQLRESFTRPFDARAAVEEGGGGVLKPGQTIAWVKSIAMPGYAEVVEALIDDVASRVDGCRTPDGEQTDPLIPLQVLSRISFGLAKIFASRAAGSLVQRGHYQPLNTNKVLNYSWEPIFTFYKPPEPDYDRLAVGAPFADKSNLKRDTRGQYGDLHCAGDTWFIPYVTTGAKKKKGTAPLKHAYGFPEELVERCVRVAGLQPGSTIMDPFLGSGTTAVVGKRLGHNVIGVEKDVEAVGAAGVSWRGESPGVVHDEMCTF